MSSKPPTDDRRDLAAEFALGLLTGTELAEARALLSRDADFRAEVERWSGRLSPLLDEVPPAEPRLPVFWPQLSTHAS